jgi:twitching motility protein PilT
LALHLRGVVSQRLVDASNGGRVLATEILTGNNRIQELVLDSAGRDAYIEMMRESEFFGMQTFDQSLFGLVRADRVTVGTALPHVRNTHEFRARAIEAGVEV